MKPEELAPLVGKFVKVTLDDTESWPNGAFFGLAASLSALPGRDRLFFWLSGADATGKPVADAIPLPAERIVTCEEIPSQITPWEPA